MRCRALLSLAPLRLEPRQRALPPRRGDASCSRAATTSRIYEPRDAWSVQNLCASTARRRSTRFARAYPALCGRLRTSLDDARPRPRARRRRPGARPRVERPGAGRRARRVDAPADGAFRLLFHDTHHRAVTDPGAMARLRPRALRRRPRLRRGDPRPLPATAAGPSARGRGTRPPTRACSARSRASRPRATWCGSATGATTSARAELERVPARAGAARSACARASTACATRTAARRALAGAGIAVRRLAAELRGARARSPRYRATVHVPRRPYAARAARDPDDPACSRRWRAGSRWSPRRGEDVEGLFAPGPRLPRRARRRRDAQAPARRCSRTATCAAALAEHGRATILRAPHLRPSRRRAARRSHPRRGTRRLRVRSGRR